MKNAAHFRPQLSRRVFAALFFAVCAWFLVSAAQAAPKPLLIYSIDVEGGQATLFVSPAGSSLLVDTGWSENDGRDALRIEAAMKDAGVKKIDHVFITHFHTDHVGGVPELVKHIQVGEFLDHGENREDSDVARHDFAAYLKAIAGHPRRVIHPGDAISIPGLGITVLTADGEHVAAIPGIPPAPNPNCATEPKWPADSSENAYSAGFLLTYGKFRLLDLGDLTGAKEIEFVCPANPIGTVDLYIASHHGLFMSNSRALVHAVHPRVAIMNNGAHKGGSLEAWQIIHTSPGLADLWQLHTAEDSDAAHNSPDAFIANLKGGSEGNWLKVAANTDGSFSVTNARTSQTRQYPGK